MMTVGELIDALSAFPTDAEVLVAPPHTGWSAIEDIVPPTNSGWWYVGITLEYPR